MVGTGKGAAADVEEALRTRAEGHVAFKIKVGVADPREDAERTRRICEALDGKGSLLICADANQGYTPEQAVDLRAGGGGHAASLSSSSRAPGTTSKAWRAWRRRAA